MNRTVKILLPAIGFVLAGCNGLFDGLYDEPPMSDAADEGFSTDATHQETLTLRVDASDFEEWNYVSLKHRTVEKRTIPLTCEGEWDGRSGITYNEVDGDRCIFLRQQSTDCQPEPEEWDFAIHRFDVRTHGGGVSRKTFGSLEEARKAATDTLAYEGDEWSDCTVMVDLSDMMRYRIGYQNIEVNHAISEWVRMDISTPPPTFEATGRVYVMRLADGTKAALKMRSYVNAKGEKGHLTIDIAYPLP